MPWLTLSSGCSLLTTSVSHVPPWWGTLVAKCEDYKPAPYINTPSPTEAREPGKIFYLMREPKLN